MKKTYLQPSIEESMIFLQTGVMSSNVEDVGTENGGGTGPSLPAPGRLYTL